MHLADDIMAGVSHVADRSIELIDEAGL